MRCAGVCMRALPQDRCALPACQRSLRWEKGAAMPTSACCCPSCRLPRTQRRIVRPSRTPASPLRLPHRAVSAFKPLLSDTIRAAGGASSWLAARRAKRRQANKQRSTILGVFDQALLSWGPGAACCVARPPGACDCAVGAAADAAGGRALQEKKASSALQQKRTASAAAHPPSPPSGGHLQVCRHRTQQPAALAEGRTSRRLVGCRQGRAPRTRCYVRAFTDDGCKAHGRHANRHDCPPPPRKNTSRTVTALGAGWRAGPHQRTHSTHKLPPHASTVHTMHMLLGGGGG
jgi:hypothetical protein